MRLAATLVHDPEVLILDEPLNGADPRQRVHFKRLLLDLAKGGRTIVLSSHILEEVEQLAESVTLVEWGGLVASELPEHLAVTLTADPADEQRRTIAISGHGARWSGVPAAIETELLAEAA